MEPRVMIRNSRQKPGQPLLFEPGTRYHYSSVGYDLLRRVEDVCGSARAPGVAPCEPNSALPTTIKLNSVASATASGIRSCPARRRESRLVIDV
jgi:hypothetical protein